MIHKIWEKDDFFMIGGKRKDMDPAVVEIKDEAIPLVWNYDWSRPPIGWCTNVRLEDGEIVCAIAWVPPGPDYNGPALRDESVEELYCRIGGYYTEIEEKREGGKTIVTKATLQGAGMVMNQYMPGFKP